MEITAAFCFGETRNPKSSGSQNSLTGIQNFLACIEVKPIVLVANSAFHIDPERPSCGSRSNRWQRCLDRVGAEAAGETAGFTFDGRVPLGGLYPATPRCIKENLVVWSSDGLGDTGICPMLLGDYRNRN